MKNQDTVPPCFYRVSVKALILNEAGDQFLITQESNGKWELPGGGLEWGGVPHEDVSREIMEEMGIKTASVAQNPSYLITFQHDRTGTWCANALYETTLENLDFTESRECVAVQFVSPDDLPENCYSNVIEFAKYFNKAKHV